MIATREMISRIAQQSTIDATKETHRWVRWKLSWGEAFFSLKDATALVMVRPLLVGALDMVRPLLVLDSYY